MTSYSWDGYLWVTLATGYNPSMTIANVGLHVGGHTAGGQVATGSASVRA